MKLSTLLFAALVLAGLCCSVAAQANATDDAKPATVPQRADLLKQLALTPEQMQRIKELNRNHRPLMAAAQEKMRMARGGLDDEIYSASPDNIRFADRLAEFKEAQAEVLALRYGHELEIRRVLTPPQLVRFKELRRQFGEGPQPVRQRVRRLLQNRAKPLPVRDPRPIDRRF